MKHDESNLQRACVTWFRYAYPSIKLIAIPNGGQRSKITASIMKAEGVLAGVPDLFLAKPNNGFGGLWIEMKTPDGAVRPSQKEMMADLTAAGYKCVVVRYFEDFKDEVSNYLK